MKILIEPWQYLVLVKLVPRFPGQTKVYVGCVWKVSIVYRLNNLWINFNLVTFNVHPKQLTLKNSKSDFPKSLGKERISELQMNSLLTIRTSGHFFSNDFNLFISMLGVEESLVILYSIWLSFWTFLIRSKIVSDGWRDKRKVDTGRDKGPFEYRFSSI